MHGDGAARPGFPGFGADLTESGAFRKADPVASNSLSSELCRLLHDLGVRHAFGLTGGANAAFVDALGKSPIKVTQFRHETGAGFAATELSLSTGEPAIVFATTGPGLLNALNGMSAARWEGAWVVLITGCTAAVRRGRWAAQETSTFTLPSELFSSGPLFDYATVVEDAAQLDVVAMRLAMGFNRPNGFVAHIALPMNIQAAASSGARCPRALSRPAGVDRTLASECADLLSSSRFGIWVGYGARRAWRNVRRFADLTGAPVISTPRGKGIVDESHERYLGVSGTGGSDDLVDRVRNANLDRILVLGTKLGEGSSFWNAQVVPPEGFIHVDIDPSVPGSAFPSAKTMGVVAEIDAFLNALIESWPRPHALPAKARSLLADSGAPQHTRSKRLEPRPGLIRPEYLMQQIQECVVRRCDTVVMADAGNAFAWTTHFLSLSSPNRYRVSTGYGSMGHFSSGVIGTALGADGKALAVVGDGSILMNNELSTAAVLGAKAVWVVLNDSRLGMVEQGMRGLGLEPVACEFPRQDFAAIARAMGCDGLRVENEKDVSAGIECAMASPRPFVLDVVVDPDAASPVTRRVESLMREIRNKRS